MAKLTSRARSLRHEGLENLKVRKASEGERKERLCLGEDERNPKARGEVAVGMKKTMVTWRKVRRLILRGGRWRAKRRKGAPSGKEKSVSVCVQRRGREKKEKRKESNSSQQRESEFTQ
ncbi:unnamed protein product [Prunus armeniaca]|uniref:Uncharacterized protein n=1 Tax=Prunus armeniaca TaxID=36596 RepID=A0A6J5V0V9_PRUAR|nr:hypothetical protein GBA52_021098 [Prunus armeniaca]CAB4282579.1 unnamed protein product [Prunus armeniaca]CAB4312993.1 unnamed protein product [Prunus armeniaca]